MKQPKSAALAGIAGACLLAASLTHNALAQTSGGTPEVAPPSGPTPRLPNGHPDLTGIWNPPYVPDMTRNGRRQQGYAEPPFSPTDSPQARQALRSKNQYGEL